MGSPITAADDAFRQSFERCEIPNQAFRHRDHLRLAWIYVRQSGPEAAGMKVAQSIRRYAEHWGAGHRYHETLSRAWVRIVALAISEAPAATGFDDVVAAQPHLLDKTLPLRHYSAKRLWSDAARRSWIEPDLRQFPGHA